MIRLIFLTLIFFIFIKHPLILVITLFFQTIWIFIFIFFITINAWPRFLFFLIFVGGLLIIFVYISSLIPNEIFLKSLLLQLILIISITITLTIRNQPINKTTSQIQETNILIPENYSINYIRTIIIIRLFYLLRTLSASMLLTQKIKIPLKTISYAFPKKTLPSICTKCHIL